MLYCLAALPDFPMLDGAMLNDARWARGGALRDALAAALRDRAVMHEAGGHVELRGYTARLGRIVCGALAHDPAARLTARGLFSELGELQAGLLTGVEQGAVQRLT